MARPRLVSTVQDVPRPTEALRLKRVGGSLMLQRAWRHPTGLEWRPVEIVPASAPDWESTDAPPAPSR